MITDSSEIGIRKPDPRIFHMTLEQLGGMAPEQSMFLDDFEANITAAEALGIQGVLVESDPASAIAALDRLLG